MNIDKIIKGQLDEYGFPYIETEIINPINGLTAFNVKTIIDTGSAYSVVKPELLKDINLLKAIGESEFKNPIYGLIKTNIFEINLKIDKYKIPNLKVRELKEPTYPCGAIIGIDLIKYCEFNYSAKSKEFTLTLMSST